MRNYLNYDKILNFFTNKEWQIADSIGKIELENYLTTCGTDSSFFVIDNNSVTGYSENMKKNAEQPLLFWPPPLSFPFLWAFAAQ